MFDVRTLLATAEGLFGKRRKIVQVRQMGSKRESKSADLVLMHFKGLRLVTLKANVTIFEVRRLFVRRKKNIF